MTNAERIIYEFNDLLAIMETMCDEGILKAPFVDQDYIKVKKTKIEKWLKYSEQQGTLIKN